MSKEFRTIGLGTAALAASLVAVAQPSAPSAGGQGAPATQPGYSSAFEGYRSFSADEVGDWRKANDTARDVGGWRAYAREIQGGSTQGGAPGHDGHVAPAAQPPAPMGSAGPAAQSPSPAAATRPAAPAPSAPPADSHQGHHQ